jgi:hypothetical protein
MINPKSATMIAALTNGIQRPTNLPAMFVLAKGRCVVGAQNLREACAEIVLINSGKWATSPAKSRELQMLWDLLAG